MILFHIVESVFQIVYAGFEFFYSGFQLPNILLKFGEIVGNEGRTHTEVYILRTSCIGMYAVFYKSIQ